MRRWTPSPGPSQVQWTRREGIAGVGTLLSSPENRTLNFETSRTVCKIV